jgi:hypothetical protein
MTGNLPEPLKFTLIRGDTPTFACPLYNPGTTNPLDPDMAAALAAADLSAQVRRRANDTEVLGALDVSITLNPPTLLIHVPAATSARLAPLSVADVRLKGIDGQGRVFERTLIRAELNAEPDVTR